MIINIKINAIQSADYETNPNCANEHFICCSALMKGRNSAPCPSSCAGLVFHREFVFPSLCVRGAMGLGIGLNKRSIFLRKGGQASIL